uniref:Protein kinase domain-containing protein n=1 Tax=Strigamia maritima TaxID=126957 RepID=T1JK19_STRMM
MNSNRSSIINSMKDLQLVEHQLDDGYIIHKTLGKGVYGHVQLATHRRTCFTVALKSVHKDRTKLKDFLREFHYNYFLSPHRNILTCYQVAFQTPDAFVYAQEIARFGDLTQLMKGNELEENKAKSIIQQVSSAMDFMHSKELVHRDIKPQNILVFQENELFVKLTDFGLTCAAGTLVKKSNTCPSNSPPEVFNAIFNEGYHVETPSDSWQLAMLIYYCLKTYLPWEKAEITDSNYTEFLKWQKRKVQRTPKYFKSFSARLNRLFRKMLEPKPGKRAPVTEVFKYLNDRWLSSDNGGISKSDSSKSNKESKNEDNGLENMLAKFGVDISVDRMTKKKRVQDWVLSMSE